MWGVACTASRQSDHCYRVSYISCTYKQLQRGITAWSGHRQATARDSRGCTEGHRTSALRDLPRVGSTSFGHSYAVVFGRWCWVDDTCVSVFIIGVEYPRVRICSWKTTLWNWSDVFLLRRYDLCGQMKYLMVLCGRFYCTVETCVLITSDKHVYVASHSTPDLHSQHNWRLDRPRSVCTA